MTRHDARRARVAAQRPRTTRLTVLAVALTATLLAVPATAMAWKPFTHSYIGDQAYRDATNDGKVTFGTHSYPLDATLLAAFKSSRAYYNAGVIGPDGFPDIVYGQAVIHPDQTGKWLRYLVRAAWAAQAKRGPGYETAAKRQGILAFAYGYLTHAAGDMWGHTLINDFADGVFPAFKDLIDPNIANAKKAASNALRHVVAEGYVGAATPGWDRLSTRRTVCSGTVIGTDCDDKSDDITRGIPFAAPNTFIYDTFIDPAAKLPVGTCGDKLDDDGDGTPDDGCPGGPYTVGKEPEPQRGAMLDYFLDQEADLQIEAAKLRFGAQTCTGAQCKLPATRMLEVLTVRGNKIMRVGSSHCAPVVPCTTKNALDELESTDEIDRWIARINSGLKQWGTFSLAVTQALFDPQARRDAQNDECGGLGSEDSSARATCEKGVGALDTVFFKSERFFFDHLLSMLGASDALVWLADNANSFLGFLSDVADAVFGDVLNPFRDLKVTIKEALQGFVKTQIRDATGVDPDQVAGFLKHPAQWMCARPLTSFKLPISGVIPIGGLFAAGEHERLDRLMGLAANHHTAGSCSSLKDGKAYDFNPTAFAAVKDSITQAKLLLLRAPRLNQVFGDVLYDNKIIQSPTQAQTYPVDARPGFDSNIMVTSLGGAEPWLGLIDGDHAWRQDGLPRFTSGARGGTGQYPAWESCLLRPAFRSLFTDWEDDGNAEQRNFPDLGDPTSPDRSAPFEPGVVVRADISIPALATLALTPGARLTASAHDTVFTDEAIKLTWKVYPRGADPASVPAQPIANGGSFTLPPNVLGAWTVAVTGSDGCASRTRTQDVLVT